jgi:N4-(beta-N-acetylglucosaminyl)-L-asparaginase
MISRRKFLTVGSLAGAAVLSGDSTLGKSIDAVFTVSPIVISTWDFGIAANAGSMGSLKK